MQNGKRIGKQGKEGPLCCLPPCKSCRLHRFRKPDVRQQSHRKMLIDAFINAIFLYDDKMVITFNYKESTKTITFAELQEAISNKNGSDLDCLAAPNQ